VIVVGAGAAGMMERALRFGRHSISSFRRWKSAA
jgi:predicted flavoprotein YhiN